MYGAAVDIFPLGLILMELLSPFGSGSERAVSFERARRGELPEAMLRDFPSEAALAARLLQVRGVPPGFGGPELGFFETP